MKGVLLEDFGPAEAGSSVAVTDELACPAHEGHRTYAIRDDRWEWPVGYICGLGLSNVVPWVIAGFCVCSVIGHHASGCGPLTGGPSA